MYIHISVYTEAHAPKYIDLLIYNLYGKISNKYKNSAKGGPK